MARQIDKSVLIDLLARPRKAAPYATCPATLLVLGLIGAIFPLNRAEAQQLRFEPSCDTSKDMMGTSLRSLVTQAFSDGKVLVEAANKSLTDPDTDRTPYRAWFGEWDWGNNVWLPGDVRRVVTKRVGLIRGAMMRWNFVFDCTDTYGKCVDQSGKAVANAYSNQSQETDPMRIWICPSFSDLPRATASRDSQAGNVVHEISHFCRNRQFNDEGACLQEPEPEKERSEIWIQATAATSPGALTDNVYAYQFFFAEFGTGCSCAVGRARGNALGIIIFLPVALLAFRRRRSR